MKKNWELKFSDLRSICDPKMFTFKTTAEVDPLDNVIGQKRAVQAIDFGLNIKSPGYNMFVTGNRGHRKINHYQRYCYSACQRFTLSCGLVHGQ